MTDEVRNEVKNESGRSPATGAANPRPSMPGNVRTLLSLPGLAAVSLYMLVLAAINVLGVVTGQIRPAYIVLSALFIASGLGLLLLFRWAWALTLAAVALLAALSLGKFGLSHQPPYIFQALLNLVFFLYLVRTEVREKLR